MRRSTKVTCPHIMCAMNLTLSLDEKLVKNGRKVASSMGKSLNQLIREHLEQLTSSTSLEDTVAELRELSGKAGGRSGGWKFDREEIHERGAVEIVNPFLPA